MLSQKVLAEIITPLTEYPTVFEDQTLQGVISTLLDSYSGPPGGLKLREVVVLNSGNEPVGLITIKDVLKGMDPKLLGTKIDHFEGIKADSSDISVLWEDPFFQKCGKTINRKVYEVYTPFDVYLKETDSVFKVLSQMLSLEKELMPVKKESRVVGVVHLEDIFVKVVSCCMMGEADSRKAGEI